MTGPKAAKRLDAGAGREGLLTLAPALIVTRPAAQASAWVQELRALGCRAQALPLIGITKAPDVDAVRRAWSDLPRFGVVMFVSANAVSGFFDCKPTGQSWPPSVLAASTGPGTSSALRAAGLTEAQIVEPPATSPQFDSEALWQQLRRRFDDWHEREVLVLRGEQGRDWLGDALRALGAQVTYIAAYQRKAPQLDADGTALLEAAQLQPASYVWLFSSSQAVAHLRQLAPQARWQHSQAWVTHPRIGQSASEAGFGRVLDLRPSAMAAAQQLQSGAWRGPYNP